MEIIENSKGAAIGAVDEISGKNPNWAAMVLMPDPKKDFERNFKTKTEAVQFVKKQHTINQNRKKMSQKNKQKPGTIKEKFQKASVETFKTPDGKSLNISKTELIKISKESIKLWESLLQEKGWKTRAKKELVFWRFMQKQTTTQNKKKTGLKAPFTKGLTTVCAMTVGVTGRRKSNGTQKKGYIAKKGGKLVKKSTRTRKVNL